MVIARLVVAAVFVPRRKKAFHSVNFGRGPPRGKDAPVFIFPYVVARLIG